MKGYFPALVALALVLCFAGTTQAETEADPPSGLIKIGSEKSRVGILTTYYRSTEQRTWIDANNHCMEYHDGNLVEITSSTVQFYVEDAIEKIPLGRNSLWTGGRFEDGTSSATRRWIWWSKKAPLTSYTYRPYGVVDPSPVGQTSNSCMATFRIGATYTWQSFNCGERFYYICVTQD